MKKYRKLPVIIDAIQWDGSEEMAIKIASNEDFEGVIDYTSHKFDGFYIKTLEGKMHVSPNDFIIKGVNGEYYLCKPDIFLKTYEPIE